LKILQHLTINIDYPEMNYYLANAEAEPQKFEPIINKTFLHMSMWHDGVICGTHKQWYGIGTYGSLNVDYSRLTEDLGPCE
jgi:hypothetical protein